MIVYVKNSKEFPPPPPKKKKFLDLIVNLVRTLDIKAAHNTQLYFCILTMYNLKPKPYNDIYKSSKIVKYCVLNLIKYDRICKLKTTIR